MVQSDSPKHAYLNRMPDPRIRPRRGLAAGGDGAMLQGHRYLEPPILGVQSGLLARSRHPDSQNPHLYSVQSCAPGPTTHFEVVCDYTNAHK